MSSGGDDKYLQFRIDGGYRYVRRVPDRVYSRLNELFPKQGAIIRRSLKTKDLAEARARRDAMRDADEALWSSLYDDDAMAHQRHKLAVERALVLRVTYRPYDDLIANADLSERLHRLEVAQQLDDSITPAAMFGLVEEPPAQTSLDDAFQVFCTAIRSDKNARKSPKQLATWAKLKRRGIANFKSVVGDIPVEAITRRDAQKFHQYWLGRVHPKDPTQKKRSASSANKDMTTMRALWREYMDYMGKGDTANPFAGLSFEADPDPEIVSFSDSWIKNVILASGALDGLNTQARLALLGALNTGLRTSEIANIAPDQILLDGNIPFLDIRARADRALKTRHSARQLPLCGVSLEALREARALGGFPRYRDSDNLSATVNKFMRKNGLMESDKHTLYSFRHSFERRLKSATTDDELRRYLMGHKVNRERYGYDDALSWALPVMQQIAF